MSRIEPLKEHVNAAIAVVIRASDDRILIAQRKDDDALGGYWEFPGGKCETGETLEQCLARELLEELDIEASPFRSLRPVHHDYPHAHISLHPFLCRHIAGEPKLIECQDARWIPVAELRSYAFPPANDALIDEVIAALSESRAVTPVVDFPVPLP